MGLFDLLKKKTTQKKALSNLKVDLLLKEAECQKYTPLASIANFEPIIIWDAETIHAKNNRVS